jgi:hypothetical protein
MQRRNVHGTKGNSYLRSPGANAQYLLLDSAESRLMNALGADRTAISHCKALLVLCRFPGKHWRCSEQQQPAPHAYMPNQMRFKVDGFKASG